MFTWLAILYCHLVCNGRKRSRHASLTQAKRDLKKEKIWSLNDVWKGYLKTWDRSNSQSFHHKGDSHELPAARANVLRYVGLWHMAIKLNLSWKMEVSKSAWIKPWFGAWVRFVRRHFWKRVLCLLAPPKQMSSLTISNENIFIQRTCLTSLCPLFSGLRVYSRHWGAWVCFVRAHFLKKGILSACSP